MRSHDRAVQALTGYGDSFGAEMHIQGIVLEARVVIFCMFGYCKVPSTLSILDTVLIIKHCLPLHSFTCTDPFDRALVLSCFGQKVKC